MSYETAGLWIVTGGPHARPVTILQPDAAVLIGRYHPRSGDMPGQSPGPDDASCCRGLLRGGWGRYVVMFKKTGGGIRSLFRDPSGALDCVVWTTGGLDIAASELPEWMPAGAAQGLQPDLATVADQLSDPTLLTGPVAVGGVRSVDPGALLTLGQSTQTLWRPGDHAGPAAGEPRMTLRTVVDETVSAGLAEKSGLLVEVSGGLDSAIIAGSVRSGVVPATAVWTNAWGPFPEADERSYAVAVAEHLRIPLETVRRYLPDGAEGVCLNHPMSFRPSLNRMDVLYDRDQAALCMARGLDTVVTGKGGDVAFYQTATPAILADRMRVAGPGALREPLVSVLSRRLRVSNWTILHEALTAAGHAGQRGRGRSPVLFVSREVLDRNPPPHPWLVGMEQLPPGKRMQVTNFAGNLALHGHCRRSGAAEPFHPLLTQPVMEATLAIPSWILTAGGHDRQLAREAFGNRLPAVLLARRSKGELGTYYGRCIAAALPQLRPHLLEGRLANAGLLDLPALDAALTVDHLILAGGYADIMILATMESWLQAWS